MASVYSFAAGASPTSSYVAITQESDNSIGVTVRTKGAGSVSYVNLPTSELVGIQAAIASYIAAQAAAQAAASKASAKTGS